MRTGHALHRPAGSTAQGAWAVHLEPEDAPWDYCGLRVAELQPRASLAFGTAGSEAIVLPLSGGAVVDCDGEKAEIVGRRDVFAGVTDFAYAPRDAQVRVTSADGGRFAVATARARQRLPFRHVPAAEVAVELRGAGACSRQINNFATPEVFAADRIIACEVLTPGGNWSSYPPHKHDESRPGAEAELEEIYYFEVADGPSGAGVGYQRVYGTEQRPIDVLAEVRSGDVVLVPHGWHGPSIASPGHDLYYLNVMAGPGAERTWLISHDPAHAWVRDTWADQSIDARLPFGTQS